MLVRTGERKIIRITPVIPFFILLHIQKNTRIILKKEGSRRNGRVAVAVCNQQLVEEEKKEEEWKIGAKNKEKEDKPKVRGKY